MFSKVAGDYCDRFSYVVSGNCEDTAIYCSDMYRCVCCMCCWLWGFISFSGKKWNCCFPSGKGKLIYGEEILFFIFFLIWTYFAGFRPQAYGTEKFMDYGFMEAMMRSTTLPARDLWYSEGTINYYYGGQYFAVFLTKLTGSKVELTYNLMRTFVAAFAFVLRFHWFVRCLWTGLKEA